MNMKPPEGKKFYGSVTISERGQIVIPAEARKDFNMAHGDKLLVFGDLKTGLWVTTFSVMEKNWQGSGEFFQNMESGMEKGNRD